MSDPHYTAPVALQLFTLTHAGGLADLLALAARRHPDRALAVDDVAGILEAAAQLAGDVLAPLNQPGDRTGARLTAEGEVVLPDGFVPAFAQVAAGGWVGLTADPAWGGQGLPHLVAMAVTEIWHAANMAFSLCPLLSEGAIDALQRHAGPALQARYLPDLVSGAITGTMNLTEPQAGSDLSQVRTRAVPLAGAGDGRFLVDGQKIYITYGEHPLTPNILHLVLARLPDAPAGAKGLSLLAVPKILPDGRRNGVRALSLEHKLGIHASPTCVMEFAGAEGWLVGEPHRGLEYMFVMMNRARFDVGVQGIALGERAWQRARAYAAQRIQGRPPGGEADQGILGHPDVLRMVMVMRAGVIAGRALAAWGAAALDRARLLEDPAAAETERRVGELLVPLIKGWNTERGIEAAGLGVQVHGGMGFVEETGAAQHLRDARITTIYEGTTGIQANDLMFRKIRRDGGATLAAMLAQAGAERAAAVARWGGVPGVALLAQALEEALGAAQQALGWINQTPPEDDRRLAAAADAMLHLLGTTLAGVGLLRLAVAAAAAGATLGSAAAGAGSGTSVSPGEDPVLCAQVLAAAEVYATQILPRVALDLARITRGAPVLAMLDLAVA